METSVNIIFQKDETGCTFLNLQKKELNMKVL